MSNSLRLEPDALIRQAQQQTGLSDFGDGPWREGLEILLDAAESEAALNATGRAILRGEMVAQLVNRLEINDWVARNPGVRSEPVEAPVVLATLPRTGQTAAGWLFDRDPTNRALRTWFVKRPVPPPLPGDNAADPRLEEARRGVAAMPEKLRNMHLTDAEEPDECHWLISNAFRGAHQIYSMHVPAHYAWSVDRAEMSDAYAYYRLQLQILQSNTPGRRWILKNSPHLLHLDALNEVLPDAHYVQFHRDPLAVLASNCRLTLLLRRMRSDAVDPREIGASILRLLSDYVERVLRFRDAGSSRPFIDVGFGDFVAEPAREIERIYAEVGAELSPSTQAAMQQWVVDNPRDARRPSTDLAPFGLDADAAREQFAAYTQRFSIPDEAA